MNSCMIRIYCFGHVDGDGREARHGLIQRPREIWEGHMIDHGRSDHKINAKRKENEKSTNNLLIILFSFYHTAGG
jgi:hypothetical protein